MVKQLNKVAMKELEKLGIYILQHGGGAYYLAYPDNLKIDLSTIKKDAFTKKTLVNRVKKLLK